jgi:hypothetical protein
MLNFIKRNLFTGLALFILPTGYYLGTQIRAKEDAKKILEETSKLSNQEQMDKLKQQLELLREERENILSKPSPFNKSKD